MKSNKITFEQYQQVAIRTAPRLTSREDQIHRGVYGLVGEVGELVDMVKKHLYQGHPWDDTAAMEEMGDILWYLAVLAGDLDFGLGTVAIRNSERLKKRYPDGFDPERSRAR